MQHLRGGKCNSPEPIVRLSTQKADAKQVKINKYRMITLIEMPGQGGPIAPILNNTRWDGTNASNRPNKDYLLVDGRYLSESPP